MKGPLPMRRMFRLVATVAIFSWVSSVAGAQSPPVDLSGYHPESGLAVRHDGDRLTVEWPMEDERGQLVLDFGAGRPLIASMAVADKNAQSFRRLIENAEPVCFLLVGSRQAPEGRPPGMSVFNVFFDSPGNRPYDSYRFSLSVKTRARRDDGARADHLDWRGFGRSVCRGAADQDLPRCPAHSRRDRRPLGPGSTRHPL